MASVHSYPTVGRLRATQQPQRDHSPVLLARMIEGEIIPRLLLAHRAGGGAAPAADAAIDPAEGEAFAPAVLALELHALLEHLETYLARGVSVDAVCTGLIAPAARRLGAMWDDDLCDFVAVTIGLWRLQQAVHELSARHPLGVAPADDRRALFTIAPGEQHTLGFVMIEESFRRAGWRTWSAAGASADELCDTVAANWFELVGLTVTLAHNVAPLGRTIAAIRRASLNPEVGVMVGGAAFRDDPSLAAAVGADATAPDAGAAVRAAETLLAHHARADASH